MEKNGTDQNGRMAASFLNLLTIRPHPEVFNWIVYVSVKISVTMK